MMKLTIRYLGNKARPIVGELFETSDHKVYFQYDSAWRDHRLELSPKTSKPSGPAEELPPQARPHG